MNPISSLTLANLRTSIPLSDKTDDEAKAIYNRAQQILADFVNDDTERTDYMIDLHNEADSVLAPTGSALANMYEDYLQIKFSGTAGVAVTATAINLTLVSTSYAIGTGLAVYTVTLSKTSGDPIDDDTIIFPGVSGQASIEKTGTTTFTVTTSIGHDDFSVFVQNMKES